jgi:hypothetical protein
MRYPSEDAYKRELNKGDKKEKDAERTIEELIKEMEDDYDE